MPTLKSYDDIFPFDSDIEVSWRKKDINGILKDLEWENEFLVCKEGKLVFASN